MVKYTALLLLLVFTNYSWAQLHPQTHQHLKDVLDYESNLENSFPVFLAIPKGLDEAEPLHFYQPSNNAVARLSTYYFSESDSLVTKTIHQWSHFNDLFHPNKPFRKEDIEDLKTKYAGLRIEMANYYGTNTHEYEDSEPNSLLYGEVTKWKNPLLYDPMLEYKELVREEDAYGLITITYVHQGWEQMVKKQLDFLQYYFINRIKEKDYKKAISLLGADLQIEVQEEHMEELHHIFTNHQLQLINSKDGFSSLEREHVYLYSLQDNEGEMQYTMTIAFNNNQDIIFLQYNSVT